jgi:sulfate adenylyltransferase subunit 2
MARTSATEPTARVGRRPRPGWLPVAGGEQYQLSDLDTLEHESIEIMREAAAGFERPVVLFSGGKDSIVLLHLAEKAFWPARVPFSALHIDTGHNFAEVLEFRDRLVAERGVRLLVALVQDSIDSGLVREESGPGASRNRLQTATLLDAVERNRFDVLIGGARRDEEKARAKERVFSFRDKFGQWNPKQQRPELWGLYNTRIRPGEHIRAFPLSNWTELDVWRYIDRERVEVPGLYFAHRRRMVERDGMLLAVNPYAVRGPGEAAFEATVRYRTVGDMTCTGAVVSSATTTAEVIEEIVQSRVTERGQTRSDDRTSESAMESRKQEGYF